MTVADVDLNPKPNRIRPLLALRYFAAMIRAGSTAKSGIALAAAGAGFVHATEGRSGQRAFARLAQSACGQQLLRQKPILRDYLSNRDRLRTMPEGSLGRAYATFMAGEGVTMDVLYELQGSGVVREKTPAEFWFNQRQEDLHDLRHLITGYDTDDFGELCLLAFRYAQTKHRGSGFLAVLYALAMARRMPRQPVLAAVREGYRRGRDSVWQDDLPWEEMLTEPLAVIQARLRLSPSPVYDRIRSASVQDGRPMSTAARTP